MNFVDWTEEQPGRSIALMLQLQSAEHLRASEGTWAICTIRPEEANVEQQSGGLWLATGGRCSILCTPHVMDVNLACEEERAQSGCMVPGSENRPHLQHHEVIYTHCKTQLLFLQASPRTQRNHFIPQQPSASVDAYKHMHINNVFQGSLWPSYRAKLRNRAINKYLLLSFIFPISQKWIEKIGIC